MTKPYTNPLTKLTKVENKSKQNNDSHLFFNQEIPHVEFGNAMNAIQTILI